MLKRLFIVRHGQCRTRPRIDKGQDGSGDRSGDRHIDVELTLDGIDQSKRAAGLILKETARFDIFVVTSNAGRAVFTANVMAGELGCSFKVADYLNLSSFAFHMALKPLIVTPELYAFQAIVFVTHYAFLMETLRATTEQLNYSSTIRHDGEMPYGAVLSIDIQQKNVNLLRATGMS